MLRRDSNGPVSPVRTITFPYGSQTLWGGVALYGREAFTIMSNFSYSDTTVEEFSKNANGPVVPTPVLAYSKSTVTGDLVVGP